MTKMTESIETVVENEPTESAGIYADVGPHVGVLIPTLVRFWTHALCALLVPLLTLGGVVAWSAWRDCIGGATASYTALRGFSVTCFEPLSEPGLYFNPMVDSVRYFNIKPTWDSVSDLITEQMVEHNLHQTITLPAETGIYINEYEPAVTIAGDGQLQLGKTNEYRGDVPCNKDNEGALLYFQKLQSVRVCNGFGWRPL